MEESLVGKLNTDLQFVSVLQQLKAALLADNLSARFSSLIL